MANEKILVVDDDKNICELLRLYLVKEGYSVTMAHDGEAALTDFDKLHPDLVLLDVMMPVMDGWEVCRKIRAKDNTPIIMLTAKGETYDKVLGLELGADDYVTKPFRPQILGAKVKALIRRSKSFSQENNQQISCGPFLCDTTTMRFYKNNVELNLSEKERSLLLLFVRHPQQVFTKDMIYEQIWGNLIAVDDNAIMVYINRLRSKIEDNARTPQHIITIRGVGYRFVP